MKTALLTGSSGFLGRYISTELEKSFTVTMVGRNFLKEPDIVTWNLATNKFDFSKKYFDLVVHAAGLAHVVPKSDAEIERFYEVNIDGTKNLLASLETCERLPEAIVFISSVSVYGLEEGESITEDFPRKAKDPYGASKIKSEDILMEWGDKYKVKISIVRLPLIAGKNPPGNLGSMIMGIKSGRYFRIGSGEARKSIVLANDVAAVIPVVAEVGGIYHLTDGIHPSFAELEDAVTETLSVPSVKKIPYSVALVMAYAGSMLEVITGKSMPFSKRVFNKITQSLTFSDDKAKKVLGWRPRPILSSLDEIIH